jgi:hypothetical protein
MISSRDFLKFVTGKRSFETSRIDLMIILWAEEFMGEVTFVPLFFLRFLKKTIQILPSP